jgi:hypothetical protein
VHVKITLVGRLSSFWPLVKSAVHNTVYICAKTVFLLPSLLLKHFFAIILLPLYVFYLFNGFAPKVVGRYPPSPPWGREVGAYGALTFSPPTFSPSDNLTHTVGPSDNWSAFHLVLVTNRPSPKPEVDELFVHPIKWTFVPQNLGPAVTMWQFDPLLLFATTPKGPWN